MLGGPVSQSRESGESLGLGKQGILGECGPPGPWELTFIITHCMRPT